MDIGYEYLNNKNVSFGISGFYNFNKGANNIETLRDFSLTAYHRWFFSERKYASGFFVEAFGMLNKHQKYNSFFSNEKEKVTDFGLGISIGGKFISKKNFVAEIYAGIGRNLFNKKLTNIISNNVISRGGISLGYRF